MQDSPFITCVIPTYCRPRMVARAIRSVLKQTFPHLRVFVTDNASGDETADVVRSIKDRDPRVIYHCQSANLGMHSNFAYGMARVETPFYSLLSDDDVLVPDFYETAYSEFQKYPQAMFVATKVPCVLEDGRITSEPLSLWDRFGLFEPPTGAHRVVAIAPPLLAGILFRSEFLKTPYSHLDSNIHAGDYEMILNASLNFPIVTVDRPGALFVRHSGPFATPSDPFCFIDYWLNQIEGVNLDDRFPPEIKVRNHQNRIRYLSGYLRGLVIRFVLQGNELAAGRALSILSDNIGRRELALQLGLFHQLCRSVPPMRAPLGALHAFISKWKHRVDCYRLPHIDPQYRQSLKLN